ncbi:hypothetical protein V8C34DRAFT_160641 [Trichoderma compactum]
MARRAPKLLALARRNQHANRSVDDDMCPYDTCLVLVLLPLRVECPSANKGGRRGAVPSRASSASLSLQGPMRHSCPVASAASARKWRQRGGFENKQFRALVTTDGMVVIPAAFWVVQRCCAWLETDIRHLSFVQDTRQTADQPAPETKLRGLCSMGCTSSSTMITYKVRSAVLVRIRAHHPWESREPPVACP